MNDERRPARNAAANSAADDVSSGDGRPAPRLIIACELEELPIAHVIAESHEDATRLGAWLDRETVRRRLHEYVDDLLDGLSEAA